MPVSYTHLDVYKRQVYADTGGETRGGAKGGAEAAGGSGIRRER